MSASSGTYLDYGSEPCLQTNIKLSFMDKSTSSPLLAHIGCYAGHTKLEGKTHASIL